MLDKRLKWAFFFATLVLASFPIAGIILDVMKPNPMQMEDRDGAAKLAGDPAGAFPEPVEKEDMVFIPAGEFLRGYNGGGFDEKPEGRVRLDAYWIDRYEVTYGPYTAFIAATGHRKPISRYVKHFDKLSGARQPAVYVSWDDADAYCRARGARLPTEAEWEKAARGPNGLLFPWGDEDRRGAANTGNSDPFEFTAPVASFPQDRSPFGVYDLGGNAMEWVADWYQEDAYKDSAPNPKGPASGLYRVIKGPSWATAGQEIRLSIRLKMVPEFRDTTIGFRCAKTTIGSPTEGVGRRS